MKTRISRTRLAYALSLVALAGLGAPAVATAQSPSFLSSALAGATPPPGNGGSNDLGYDDKHHVYLQVWGHPLVYGRFVNANGAAIGSQFVIANQSSSDAFPRVTYTSAGSDDIFMVTFTSELGGGRTVYGRLLSHDSNLNPTFGPIVKITELSGLKDFQTNGGAAWDPFNRRFFTVWEDARLGGENVEVYGALWALNGTGTPVRVGADVNVSNAAYGQGTPNVAFDWQHKKFMVVYRGANPNVPSTLPRVYGSWAKRVTFDAAGTPTVGPLIDLHNPAGEPGEQNIVYLPEADGFLTFWTMITSQRDVLGTTLSDDGAGLHLGYPILATAANEGAADADYNAQSRRVDMAMMRDATRYVLGITLNASGEAPDSYVATTQLPKTIESLYPHVVIGENGRFGIGYINDFQYAFTDLRQDPMAAVAGPIMNLAPPCTVTLASSSNSVSRLGGTDAVAVTGTSPSGCEWSTSSSAGWLTVTSGTGSGTGTISYSWAPNASHGTRSATLTVGGQTFTVGQASSMDGFIDVDGDSSADFLWQNQSDGRLAYWRMSGTTLLSSTLLNPSSVDPTSARLVGSGDFDGDGDPDLLWQDISDGTVTIWLMSGSTRVATVNVGQVVDTAWRIEAVADMDRDGWPDIIWHNDSTGRITIWLMNGTALSSNELLSVMVSDTDWHIAGSGDFNGDGKPDLLWQHANGALSLWYMNGTAFVSYTVPSPGRVDPSWRVRGVADVNEDGHPDVLWQNPTYGYVSAWIMSGASYVRSVGFPRVADPAWHLVAPR